MTLSIKRAAPGVIIGAILFAAEYQSGYIIIGIIEAVANFLPYSPRAAASLILIYMLIVALATVSSYRLITEPIFFGLLAADTLLIIPHPELNTATVVVVLLIAAATVAAMITLRLRRK